VCEIVDQGNFVLPVEYWISQSFVCVLGIGCMKEELWVYIRGILQESNRWTRESVALQVIAESLGLPWTRS
jgi:hypothetical protein